MIIFKTLNEKSTVPNFSNPFTYPSGDLFPFYLVQQFRSHWPEVRIVWIAENNYYGVFREMGSDAWVFEFSFKTPPGQWLIDKMKEADMQANCSTVEGYVKSWIRELIDKRKQRKKERDEKFRIKVHDLSLETEKYVYRSPKSLCLHIPEKRSGTGSMSKSETPTSPTGPQLLRTDSFINP